jgi:hypothetical protein
VAKPFEREARCPTCGREYKVAGLALHPGAETEGPTGFRCACGDEVKASFPAA